MAMQMVWGCKMPGVALCCLLIIKKSKLSAESLTTEPLEHSQRVVEGNSLAEKSTLRDTGRVLLDALMGAPVVEGNMRGRCRLAAQDATE